MPDTPLAPTWVRLAAEVIRRMPAGRFQAINRIHRMSRSAFWMRSPNALGAWSFRCDLRDSIAREVCFTGRYEPQETALVQTILKPGMTFVDVGANWGYFTLLAAHQVGTSGKVVSLEPDPRLFPMLAANIAVNGMSQAHAMQVAAGAGPGLLTLAGFAERGGNFGLSRVVRKDPTEGPLFHVAARSLDDVIEELHLHAVDLLKMDIEGAEGLALLGLRRTLADRRVRRILIELHPAQLAEHGQVAANLLDELRQAGYDAWRIDHSRRANRWASYQRHIDVRRVLQPLEAAAPLDPWPHILLVLQGMDPAS
jgi:FkbM family methyltransferase